MPSENGETDTEYSEHDIDSSVGGRSTPRQLSSNQSTLNENQVERKNSANTLSTRGKDGTGSDPFEKWPQSSSNIKDDSPANVELATILTSEAPSGTSTLGPLPAAVSPQQGLLEPKPGATQDAGCQFEGDTYFVPRAAKRKTVDASSRATSSSTLASSGISFAESLSNSNSAPHSPQASTILSDEVHDGLPQITNSPTSHPKPPRPTSVPVLSTNSTNTRKRRDGPEYPRYPNQSFTALQSQQYHQPHPLRTRSSHPSQNSSYSSIPSRASGDNISLASGVKTVGNTPAQSPSLFSPIYPANRNQVEESEDSQTSTPLLHPAHMQTPKE